MERTNVHLIDVELDTVGGELVGDSRYKLLCGLFGKCCNKNARRIDVLFLHKVGDTLNESERFSGPWPRGDKERPLSRGDRTTLGVARIAEPESTHCRPHL